MIDNFSNSSPESLKRVGEITGIKIDKMYSPHPFRPHPLPHFRGSRVPPAKHRATTAGGETEGGSMALQSPKEISAGFILVRLWRLSGWLKVLGCRQL